MRRRGTRSDPVRRLGLAVAVVVSVAVSSPSGISAAPDDGWRRVRPRAVSWSIRIPRSWTVVVVQQAVSLQVMYASDQDLRDPCVTDDAATRCGRSPVVRLEPNGALVLWTGGTVPRPDASLTQELRDASGRPAVIDGRPAKIDRDAPVTGQCAEIGADRVVTARILRDERFPVSIWACLRGPDLERATARVVRVLRSIRFAT